MENKSTFACAINCMDGRVQDAVKNYMKENYGVDYVDMVTEPGPNKILVEGVDKAVVEDIKKRVEISVGHHGAKVVAVVGHFGCAGNPVGKEEQILQLKKCKDVIKSFGFPVEVILLWVDNGWDRAEKIEE
jgi:carbonic anhydrase